jgi:hypothetical protein
MPVVVWVRAGAEGLAPGVPVRTAWTIEFADGSRRRMMRSIRGLLLDALMVLVTTASDEYMKPRTMAKPAAVVTVMVPPGAVTWSAVSLGNPATPEVLRRSNRYEY